MEDIYTFSKVTVFHGCFSHFLNWVNNSKSHNASHIYYFIVIKRNVTMNIKKHQTVEPTIYSPTILLRNWVSPTLTLNLLIQQ